MQQPSVTAWPERLLEHMRNSLVTVSASLPWCSSELVLPRLPFIFLSPGLRTVASCVRIVASGPAHWTNVAPENGASHFPVGRLELVGAVNLHSLSIFVAEATKLVGGGAAAAGVRQAADWAHLCWAVFVAVVFGEDAVFLTPPGLTVAPRWPSWFWVVQSRALIKQWVQIQVVTPHVKGALTLDSSFTLDLDFTIGTDLTMRWSHC